MTSHGIQSAEGLEDSMACWVLPALLYADAPLLGELHL
eukprot:CAMPEP_0177586828 /NCGR_PEP_ID=MMETSP0419_2-20121207/5291_1 /TAXON_ID=582737 /ORGANISM="Tetraselmis sp., Strain GSL018" /LENGTH=37 /DNA_ID= /DNA_START= /DNA_END= /DNA_ORIENTATION=